MKHYNIPIFVPHKGCPFDCVFCNQKHITGTDDDVNENTIKNTVEEYLKTLLNNDRYVEIAFFGGSFTGIDFDLQRRFLSTAYEYIKKGQVDGIRLSTRPDYISYKILDQLKKYGVTTIELGVQSMIPDVLTESNRGHDITDVCNAVSMIREYDFDLGLQMMTGLPGDDFQRSLKTADELIKLAPDFVRIYPTLVIKDTYLEKMYENGTYTPQTVDDAVTLCKELLIKFEKADIQVIRVALQTTDEISPGGSLVAGPFDSQFRELVESEIYYDKFYDHLNAHKYKNVLITVNNKEVSKAIGKGRKNLKKLKNDFNIDIKIKGSDSIDKGNFKICESLESEE